MNIQDVSQTFTDISELQAYTNAQYQTIIELSKKCHTLEEERNHLRKLLENGTPLIKENNSLIELFTDVSDEEAICRMELKKLKVVSIERELTLEEAKRTEIYTKLLVSLRDKTKEETPSEKRLDDASLIALLTDDNTREEHKAQ